MALHRAGGWDIGSTRYRLSAPSTKRDRLDGDVALMRPIRTILFGCGPSAPMAAFLVAMGACSSATPSSGGGGEANASTVTPGASSSTTSMQSPSSGGSSTSRQTPDAGGSLTDAHAQDAADLDAADGAGDGGNAPGASDGGDAGSFMSLGYYTGTTDSYNALKQNQAYVTMISADLFDVTADGGVVGGDDSNGVAFARSVGMKTYACVSNYSDSIGDFDPALGHAAMVTNKTATIASIVDVAKTGYTGINIDFESLAYSASIATDRSAYSSFIHDLGVALHGAGEKLLISVPAKTADDPTDTWGYPYDFATLAADVNLIQLMTYDENGPGWSGPGPVSGEDWVASCVAYAISVAPAAKLLIGLPAYGYDWDLTSSNASAGTYVGTSVTWVDFATLLATSGAVTHWDATSLSPYVDYTASNGHKHELWYENAQSIQDKSKLVPQYHLAGASMWALGDEDSNFWKAVFAGL